MCNNLGNGFERLREFRVLPRIFFREISDACRGFRRVVVEKQSSAVRRRGEHARVRRENLATKPLQLHVACNIGAQWAEGVRQCGSAEAGIEFLGDGAAANHFAAFENQRLETTPG